MKNNKITMHIQDGKCYIRHTNPLTIAEVIESYLKVILAAMQDVVARAPEESREKVTEELYDLLNIAASNTLAIFAPELELRPHLTTQAILEKENEIIMQGRAPALSIPEQGGKKDAS